MVTPQLIERTKALFPHLGFEVVTRTRYIGGHIGKGDGATAWVEEKVEKWEAVVIVMSRVAHSSPHTAFVGLQKRCRASGCTCSAFLAI